MLSRIMSHEWRNLSADRTLWLVTLLFGVLIGYGLYNGVSWVRFRQEALRAAAEDERDRHTAAKAEIEDLAAGRRQPRPFADPRSPAVAGSSVATRYATMPSAPLAPLSVGQSDLYPYYFKVTRASKQTFISNDEIENPDHLLAGRFDLAFVIIYLYPLLILALSYNLISQEKEQGTLAMLMSQPIALKTLVLGKVGLRAAVVVLLAVGFSLAGFLASGGSLDAGGALWRLALWTLVVASYGAFWFCVGVLVNAWGKSSATNALTLAAVWLLLVLLVPSLVNVVVTAAYPVPSRVEMIQAVRRASTEATTRGSQLLAKYYEDHPDLVPDSGKPDLNDFYTRAVAVQTETEKLTQPVIQHFDHQALAQQGLVDRFRFLSPAIVTQAALNDLAGTSAHRYRHFLSLVDAFHQSWRDFFNPKILRQTKLTADDYDQAPAFLFSEEPSNAVAGRVSTGLLGLIAPAALIGLVALATLRRYPLTG
jgi:ABC-2 type transport system permease protein